MSDATTTRINRKWIAKQVLIASLFLVCGLIFLYDAVLRYPARGAQAAEYYEFQYLQQLDKDKRPLEGIDDPKAQLARLRSKDPTLLSPTDQAMYQWLNALSIIGKDSPENTRIPRDDFRGEKVTGGRERLSDLGGRWNALAGGKARSPSPLSSFDIPSQWLVVAICWPIGLYILFLIVRVKTKTFGWDPGEQRLTLADGGSVTPADLADIDKRLWHKYYVVLKVKDTHPQYPGREIKLDLLRYEPLEEWVLAMERAAFPDRAEPEPQPQPLATDEPAPEDEQPDSRDA